MRTVRSRSPPYMKALFPFAISLLLLIDIVLPLSDTLKITSSTNDINPENPFKRFAIPQIGPHANNSQFAYSKFLPNSTDQCVDRAPFFHEFARTFDKNFAPTKLETPCTLIIGSSTVLGNALKRHFTKQNVPFISLNGIN